MAARALPLPVERFAFADDDLKQRVPLPSGRLLVIPVTCYDAPCATPLEAQIFVLRAHGTEVEV